MITAKGFWHKKGWLWVLLLFFSTTVNAEYYLVYTAPPLGCAPCYKKVCYKKVRTRCHKVIPHKIKKKYYKPRVKHKRFHKPCPVVQRYVPVVPACVRSCNPCNQGVIVQSNPSIYYDAIYQSSVTEINNDDDTLDLATADDDPNFYPDMNIDR